MFMFGPLTSLNANGRTSVFCSLYRPGFNYRRSILLTNLRRCCVNPLNEDMGVEYFTVMTRYHVPVDFYDLAIQAFQCPVPARITFVPQQVTGSFQRCGRSPHRKKPRYE